MPFVWLLPLALIITTAIVAGFFAHPIQTPTTTPEPTVLATQTTEPSPTASPEPTILGTQTTEPTPSPRPSPAVRDDGGPTPTTTVPATQNEVSISFIDLPSTLSAGQKTKITIKIDGPSGTKGDNAKIKVKYYTENEKNGSSSSIKSDISNGFGSFTTPATFSMNLSLGQEKAPIELTASAEINGQTIETTRTVTLN